MTETIFERSYRDHKTWFTAKASDPFRIVIDFHGKGTVDGTRAFLQIMDEAMKEYPEDLPKSALLDVSDLQKTPIRSQAIMGKWLLQNKHLVGHVALVGAKRWERAVAKTVMKIARMKRIDFFDSQSAANRWLDAQHRPSSRT